MIQNTYIGKGSIASLSDILKPYSGKKIFLVTGKSSYEKSGAKSLLEEYLKDTEYIRFSDFEENPKLEDVEKGIHLFKEANCELTIAIGGGSAIDIAKLINSLAYHSGSLQEVVKGNRLEQKPFPLIAIPTTAGTGSEATHFAVVYINGEKFSFAHNDLLPGYVIVDSQFTYSTPAYLAACTGADALCQAIESMWATGGNEESREYAAKAIELVWNNLKEAVVNNDHLAKDKVSEGAFWAGKAINISKTTASHALSYKLTSRFGVPHGHAVALTLAQVMEANYEFAQENVKRILSLLQTKDLSDGVAKISKFWESLGLAMKLSELGIEEQHIAQLSNCNLERLKNNPAVLSKEFIENLFRSII
ncbi:MAG: phosphonoacetaldehyde reductase [Marinifilaceae bacterium]